METWKPHIPEDLQDYKNVSHRLKTPQMTVSQIMLRRLVYFEVWLQEGGRALGSTLPCTENCITIAARRAVVETSKNGKWEVGRGKAR